MVLGARCWFRLCSLVLGHGVGPERSNSADLATSVSQGVPGVSADGWSVVKEKLGTRGDVV